MIRTKYSNFLYSFQRIFVRLGETPEYESSKFTDHEVVRSVIHPEAKANELKNNLAILFLENDVEFSGELKEIPLNQYEKIWY